MGGPGVLGSTWLGLSMHLEPGCRNIALAWLFSGACLVAADDWDQLARQTLANYALSKANGAPSDVFCSKEGKQEDSCLCWNPKGKPEIGKDCNDPYTCLIYKTSDDGNFTYG